jgi:methionyl-tRNA formyltransferase
MAARFRAVFFGTPEIAVPALRALTEVSEVVGVVCQPDRPSGRGMKLRAPAVKSAALDLGLDVVQPVRVRSGELEGWLRERDADVALVLAYGRILPRAVLETPRRGCLNLHASLLPRYRGAAPIQRALMEGQDTTGISLMQMDEGLDTGPVLARRSLPVGPEETAGELAERLAELAAQVTREDVPRAVRGELTAAPQDHERATHAPPLTREDELLHFDAPARILANRVRGLSPRPGAHALLTRPDAAPAKVRVLRARAVFESVTTTPGEVLIRSPRILVGTGEGLLEILEAQLEGRRALPARDLVNGRALREGDRLLTPALEAPRSPGHD